MLDERNVGIDDLPPVAREIAEVIGLAPTCALIAQRGGTRLYVPATIGADHPLAIGLGAEAASALASVYARDTIDVPRAHAAIKAALHRAIVAAYTRGTSAAALARAHRCTERWVYELVRRHRARAALDERQHTLL